MPANAREAMVTDPLFNGCGQKPGLTIWRIENFKVVPMDSDKERRKAYDGSLYSGDCYIILHTYQKALSNGLEWKIHFWQGKDSSQDEKGVSAYKTVELDTYLGDAPVQMREVQNHESPEFLRLFPKGVKYLEGGVATGFKHVDRDAHDKRMFHIKGRRTIRVQQVPLNIGSLNSGDSFILDVGTDMFLWNGKSASRHERTKAIQTLNSIKDEEHGGKCNVHIIEEGVDNDEGFYKALGMKKGPIKRAEEAGDDESHTRATADNTKLYSVSDASGKMVVTEIKSKPLKHSDLNTNDTFILALPDSIFVWVGKGATREEKNAGMKHGLEFIKSKGMPEWTAVQQQHEFAETPVFKQNFQGWPAPKGVKADPRKLANTKGKTFNVAGLHSAVDTREEIMVDDGSGRTEMWRIEDFKAVKVDKVNGHLYGGDSYIFKYTYKDEAGKECYLIYFWQGHQSSQDEKGASAILAKEMDDAVGGAAVQIRVVQNKEPKHFAAIFKKAGGLVIHMGGKASGFKNRNDKDNYDTDGTRLFHVRGTNEWNTKATQVPEKAASLNSGDVFLLEHPKGMYMWVGKGASGDEREYAKKIAPMVAGTAVVLIEESREPADFWAAIGGKGEYSQVKPDDLESYRAPRLFQASNDKGYFYVEEVYDFDQEDLVEEDVMILDTYREMFVWVGKGANAVEKKGAYKAAIEFVESDKSGRKLDDVTILVVNQGFEPPMFTGQFLAWDPKKWSKGMSWAELKASAQTAGFVHPRDISAELAKLEIREVPYSTLTSGSLPEGVDESLKEQYLNEAEFAKHFEGMLKKDFNKLPKWKQSAMKKKANLY